MLMRYILALIIALPLLMAASLEANELPVPAADANRWDGEWNRNVSTTCSASGKVNMKVEDGTLRGEIVLRGVGSGPYYLSGELDKYGAVDDGKMTGTVSFLLQGDFDVKDAAGTFDGGYCSGTWRAVRVGGVPPTLDPERSPETANSKTVYCKRKDGTVYRNSKGSDFCGPHKKITRAEYDQLPWTLVDKKAEASTASKQETEPSSDAPLEAKLVKLKKLVEKGLITEEEAASKRSKLLEDF